MYKDGGECHLVVPTSCKHAKCPAVTSKYGNTEIDMGINNLERLKVGDIVKIQGTPHKILKIRKNDENFMTLELQHGVNH